MNLHKKMFINFIFPIIQEYLSVLQEQKDAQKSKLVPLLERIAHKKAEELFQMIHNPDGKSGNSENVSFSLTDDDSLKEQSQSMKKLDEKISIFENLMKKLRSRSESESKTAIVFTKDEKPVIDKLKRLFEQIQRFNELKPLVLTKKENLNKKMNVIIQSDHELCVLRQMTRYVVYRFFFIQHDLIKESGNSSVSGDHVSKKDVEQFYSMVAVMNAAFDVHTRTQAVIYDDSDSFKRRLYNLMNEIAQKQMTISIEIKNISFEDFDKMNGLNDDIQKSIDLLDALEKDIDEMHLSHSNDTKIPITTMQKYLDDNTQKTSDEKCKDEKLSLKEVETMCYWPRYGHLYFRLTSWIEHVFNKRKTAS